MFQSEDHAIQRSLVGPAGKDFIEGRRRIPAKLAELLGKIDQKRLTTAEASGARRGFEPLGTTTT